MKLDDETIAICTLNKIFGYEPKTGHLLLEQFSNAADIFKAGREELREIMGPSKYLSEINSKILDETEAELIRLDKDEYDFITIRSNLYPSLLRDVPDAPLGLYINSKSIASDILNQTFPIAVVGTREASAYGEKWCERIMETFARCPVNPQIISGLAIGIDRAAHLSALENNLPTIAVMATGIERIYPFRNGYLADNIASAYKSGLITDYPPGTNPTPINFLRRNRIIAGMTKATILLESKAKGGGMITARLAYSYNRDVYALPGRLTDRFSIGCNILLKEKTAEIIYSPEDLADKLGLGSVPEPLKPDIEALAESLYQGMSSSDKSMIVRILKTVQQENEIGIDELCRVLDTEHSRLFPLLMILQTDKLIKTDILQRCTITKKLL